MKKFSVSSIFRRPCYGLIVIALISIAQATNAQSEVKISGTVIDRKTKEPVPYVNIYTKSLSGGTATNEQGEFVVNMKHTDTLVFSAVGFDRYFFSLKQDEIRQYYEVVIELDFRTYELEPVKVTAYQDIEQFKKEILDLNIPSKEKELTISIPRNARIYDNHPTLNNGMVGGGATVRGAVTALYNVFSKEGKELRKLEAYRQESSQRRIVQSKYNLDIVKSITSLNEEGALRFMEWCKFDDEFVLSSTEYEITIAVLKCLDEFSKNDTVN